MKLWLVLGGVAGSEVGFFLGADELVTELDRDFRAPQIAASGR